MESNATLPADWKHQEPPKDQGTFLYYNLLYRSFTLWQTFHIIFIKPSLTEMFCLYLNQNKVVAYKA